MAPPRHQTAVSGTIRSGKGADAMARHIDPVCGMEIDGARAVAKEKVEGKTYYFCSVHCRESFLWAPGAYLRARKAEPHRRPGHDRRCG